MALIAGCGGASEPEGFVDERVPRLIEAGDLDPYGCPYVEPVPWVGKLAHAQVCGPGCEPDGANSRFTSCLSEDVPTYPYEGVSQVRVCMVHPVTGKEFRFSTPATAYPYDFLCWGHCNSDGPPWYLDAAPEECFESEET
ncbi:MAG: hypothetical protein WBG86_19130 [Polyangiales bacterium]